jgi:hypothetical protein
MWWSAACSSPLLQCSSLLAIYFSRVCLLQVCMEISSLPFPHSLVGLQHPTLSSECPFQFLVYYSVFFLAGRGPVCPGAYAGFIPRMVVGILHAAYLLTCWCTSPKQVWSWHVVVWEPSCFLGVTWSGVALYWLGAQGSWVLLLLGVFFLPSLAPASQQDFWFMELMLSASSL